MRSDRWTLLARACAVLVVVAGLIPAFAGGRSNPSSGTPRTGGVVGPAADDPVLLRQGREEVQRADRRRDRRATPEARAERARSRFAFAGQDRDEALKTAKAKLPSLLDGRPWTMPTELREGRVHRFVGTHQAVVERGGEERLLHSALPLRTRNGRGELAPVDIALDERPEVYEPTNPLTRFHIWKDVSKGVTFAEAGLTVRPVGSRAGDVIEPELVDGKLFWANIDRDTDFMVAPMPFGVETFSLLRSSESPELHELAFDLPDDATLTALDGGRRGAEVRRDGKPIAQISPALAVDADGETVPVDMIVRDDRLVLRVEHRDRDVAYPIAVDPVIDDYAWWGEEELAQWGTGASPPGSFEFSVDSRLWIDSYDHLTYPHTASGDWYWASPGDAYIAAAEFFDARSTWLWASGFDLRSCISEGVFSLTRWAWEQGSWHVPGTPFGGATPWTTCDPDHGGHVKVHNLSTVSPGNILYFRHWQWGAGRRTSFASLAAVRLWLGDSSAPTVYEAAAQPRWIHPRPGESNVVVSGDARDAGLGIKSLALTGAGQNQTQANHCAGTAYAPCPSDTGTDFAVNTTSWSDGLHRLNVSATDILGQSSAPRPVTIGIDRVRPTAPQLSGALRDRAGQTLPHGQYQLHMSAQDGNPAGPDSARQSGVVKFEVHLGKPGAPDSYDMVHEKVQNCAADSCSLSHTWTLDTLQEAGGPTSIKVVAVDGVGRRTPSEPFTVTLPESGELVTPKDQARTPKWLGLQAKANATDYTAVRFQYRKRTTPGVWGAWEDIPAAHLARQGQPVTGVAQPLNPQDRKNQLVVWDVPATVPWSSLGSSSPVVPLQVRAVFTGGSGGSTRVHDIVLDQDAPGRNATQQIGPGEVDLLSGNFSYTAKDAEIASFGQALTVTRTYNSRVPSSAPAGPFGVRTWTLAVVAGSSGFIGAREATDGSRNVEILEADGSSIWFEARDDRFIPEPGYEDLKLYPKEPAPPDSGCTGDVYQLADVDGNATFFERQAGEWVVCSVRQPGDSQRATTSRFLYENGTDGKPRIKKVAAPAPAGSSCLSTITAGCRVLEFVYGSSGVTNGRLTTVKFHSSDGPSGGESVVQYEYAADGKLAAAFDPRISPALRETYGYTVTESHRLETITPPGETGWRLSYQPLPSGDASVGRLSAVERPAGGPRTSVFYKVPVSGPAAPYEMGAAEVARWGQAEPPSTATAIVPPTELSPSANSPKATVHYLDHAGRRVNVVAPKASNTPTNFDATTTEYDEHDNVVRELSAENRRRALAMGGAAHARQLDVQRVYSPDGLELVEERGPLHEVKLDSGSVAQARSLTTTTYTCNDQTPKAHLPAQVTVGGELTGGGVVDTRRTTTEYDCGLRKPTKVVKDAGGLNITETTRYDAATGLPVESRMPRNPNPNDPGDASTTKTVYYGDGSDPDCGGHLEWWNLPCKTMPAAQPNTSGLPDLPVTTFTYNRLQQVVTEAERVGSVTRTTTTGYDAAGRKQSESTTASGGVRRGLVAAYGFEEGTGSSVLDASGRNNSGAVAGATWTTAGRFGSALDFDGDDDWVTVADSPSLDLGEGMTLEAWVKPRTNSGWRSAVMKEATSGFAYVLYANTQHNAPQGAVVTSTGFTGATGDGPIATNGWAHLAATYDGSNVRLYVNGVLVRSRPRSGPIEETGGALRIGANSIWDFEDFDGLIDEVRVYERALSGAELRSDMATPISATNGSPTSEPEGLVASYGLNEGEGNVAGDDSGDRDGSLPAPRRVSPGRFGSALDFDGLDDGIEAPHKLVGFPMTAEFWVRSEEQFSAQRHFFYASEANGYNGWGDEDECHISQDSRELNAWCKTGNATAPQLDMRTAAPSDGAWHHVAVVFDQTSRMYVDGVERATDTSVALDFTDYANKTWIGRPRASERYFDGKLDEFRVYGRALTQAEVQADKDTAIAAAGGAPSGLLAAYGFDEPGGSTIEDASSANRDLSLPGPAWTTAARFGNGLDFNGTGQGVRTPDSTALDLRRGITLEAWVKPRGTLSGADTLVAKDDAYFLQIWDGRPVFGIETDPSAPWNAANNIESPTPLNSGVGYHIAGTYDGATLKIYVNGELRASKALQATAHNSTSPLRIGTWRSSSDVLDGVIDEVRVYNRALSDAEIATDNGTPVSTHYSNDVGEPVPPATLAYSATTGRPTTVTAGGRTITTSYDSLGRVTSYTDADGNVSATSYDALDRPVTTGDGKGTQTRTYDPTSGLLTNLDDSHAGAFTASYDADGKPTSQTYPNGLRATTTYDESGAPRSLAYQKTMGCSANCTWIDEQVTESIHGQWRDHATQYRYGALEQKTVASASASTVEHPSHTANMAIDGNSGTRWSSQFIDNQWWQADLGSVQQVSQVELDWEDAYASQYKILVSTDGQQFDEVATETVSSEGTKKTEFATRNARYVRIQGVTRGTPYGISFWEARILGPSPQGAAGSLSSSQRYRYDGVGRLTRIEDTYGNQGCLTRTYAFDADSNRTSLTRHGPASGGACDTSGAGDVTGYSYDAADRLTASGTEYDPFGRMTTVPGRHAGGGALRTGYYVNDMVRSQYQDGVGKSWQLDPTGTRHRATVPNGNAQEILHYADGSDSPAWTEQRENGTTTKWQRTIEGIAGDLVAIHDSDGNATTFQLTNLHGDVVATASSNPNATAPLETFEADEFGNPRQRVGRRYGWLGAKQRRSELPSGVVQMGVRSYVPAMGRFTSVDPVVGGSANAYDYAHADPVNAFDLDGRFSCRYDIAFSRLSDYTNRKGERKTHIAINVKHYCKGRDVQKMDTTFSVQRHTGPFNALRKTVHGPYSRHCDNTNPGRRGGVMNCGMRDRGWSCRKGHTYTIKLQGTLVYLGGSGGRLRLMQHKGSDAVTFKC